jgi:hypothetical protein
VGPNLDYCLRDFPPCDSDADCLPDQVCTVQDTDDGLSKVTECRPPLDPGGAPGDDCSTSVCANGQCDWSDYCTEVCSDASQCTDQYLGYDTTCVFKGFWVTPGECGRDEQCPTNYTCQNTLCRGPACTIDSQCLTAYACDPTDQVCVPDPYYDYLGVCRIECVSYNNCPVGWICVPAVLADGSRVQGYCRVPYTGPTTPTGGGPCGNIGDPLCEHGLCFNAGGGNYYCTQLCGEALDCPVGMNCTAATYYTDSLGDFPIYVCTFS